ncbi:MAG: hypothetical protein H7Y60_12840 [Rhodospirillaceae bacterium]|nr:hypothetical protein [Rhodospirillales bacterium]
MLRLAAIASAALLSACAVSTTPINGPNGLAYEIDCSRGANTLGDCYNAAAMKCPKGYRLVGSDTSTSGGVIYGGYFIPSNNQSIIVECKDAVQKEPASASPRQ